MPARPQGRRRDWIALWGKIGQHASVSPLAGGEAHILSAAHVAASDCAACSPQRDEDYFGQFTDRTEQRMCCDLLGCGRADGLLHLASPPSGQFQSVETS